MQLQSPSSRALSDALQTAAKCIGSKNSISILDNVLLSRRADGQFLFTAATQDSQLTIPAPLNLLDGKFEAPVALPVNGIISYLSTLPDCVVNLTLGDNHSLTLDYCTGNDDRVKKGKVSLAYLDGNEFPKVSGIDSDNKLHICLPASVILPAIEQAKIFSATDELRLVMNTLCIHVSDDTSECYLVSTDGHSLIKITHTNNPATGGSDFFRGGSPAKMLVHNRFFKTISAFSACESIDILTDGNTIIFSSNDIEFICKAVEGNYPNYNSVIPKNNPFFITVNKKELLNVIKRVSLFGSDATKLVKIQKEGMFLNVSAQDIDFSTYAEDQALIINSECNDGLTIGFHSQKLSNVLNAINTNDVRINLSEPSRPAVITPDDPNPLVMTLAMPMLLNE